MLSSGGSANKRTGRKVNFAFCLLAFTLAGKLTYSVGVALVPLCLNQLLQTSKID